MRLFRKNGRQSAEEKKPSGNLTRIPTTRAVVFLRLLREIHYNSRRKTDNDCGAFGFHHFTVFY